jgi:hypothetical protein
MFSACQSLGQKEGPMGWETEAVRVQTVVVRFIVLTSITYTILSANSKYTLHPPPINPATPDIQEP